MDIDSARMIEEFSNTKIDIARYEETEESGFMHVFYNEEWDKSEDVVVYGFYHKYWTVYKQEKNPKFDIYSGKILDLKEGKELAILKLQVMWFYLWMMLQPAIIV